MIGGINVATSQIASIYNQGNQDLSSTLTKIASGKKFQNASEDFIGFTRANNLDVQINSYNDVKQNLTSAKTITSAAVEMGSKVYEDLTKMKDYAQKYITEKAGANDATKLAEYKAEFDALKTGVASSLQNAKVDGTTISQTATALKTVDLDPNGTGQLAINFSASAVSANVSAFDITTLANTTGIQTEIDNSLTYMSEAKGYSNIIDSQMKLNDTIVNSKQAVKSLITDIDEASEMSKMLDQNVRQQAAMSMLSQANVSRQIVMKLY
jgi:flagellin